MMKGTPTRAEELPQADKRWRVKVLIALLLVFVIQLVSALVLYLSVHGNREVGRGNRTVQCTTLEEIAPQIHLPECTGSH